MAADRRGPGLRPLAAMGTSPQRLQRIYRRHYASDAAAERPTASSRDAEELEAYRSGGRRLVTALVAYLDSDQADTGGRDDREAEATLIVDDQAARLAASGTSLTEAVALFVAARQPFLAELADLGRRRSLDSARLAALYGDASSLLDRLLLRFIAAHQRSPGQA